MDETFAILDLLYLKEEIEFDTVLCDANTITIETADGAAANDLYAHLTSSDFNYTGISGGLLEKTACMNAPQPSDPKTQMAPGTYTLKIMGDIEVDENQVIIPVAPSEDWLGEVEVQVKKMTDPEVVMPLVAQQNISTQQLIHTVGTNVGHLGLLCYVSALVVESTSFTLYPLIQAVECLFLGPRLGHCQ